MEFEKHLCQLNLATMKTSLDHPSMKEFVDALDSINQLAEEHQGFVWRLKDETTGNASLLKPFGENILVNMSVWEDAESLRDFVYKSHHMKFLKRRAEWFEKVTVYQALWWVPKGHVPTQEEAKLKFEDLQKNGSSSSVFGFTEALRTEAPHA